ncbi:MAG: dihydroneopterin aldolase [Bacteroidaceae bacterium]|nr:dihydroneopterin aldolase [Bacteroidaceae bacterium]
MYTTDYTIQLKGVHLYAHHGVMEQERTIGAWFTVDIELEISEYSCLESDNIEGTVSYADVYEIISREMATPSRLLENVCYRISKAIYEAFGQVKGITMTLTKDTPPMGGDRLNAAVTIKSRREA